MNPITSSEFRNNNQILHTTRILQGAQFGYVRGSCSSHQVSYQVNVGDVVDMNNNGQPDYTFEKVGWLHFKETGTEPVLTHDFNQVKEYALQHKSEVLTQDDIKLLVDTPLVVDGHAAVANNPRPIGTLVDQLEPFEPNAKWAVDVTTGEFLVYKPKA